MDNASDSKLASEKPSRLFWPTTMAEWVEVSVKLGVIVGGLFALFQFLDGKQSERVKTTLQYVARFENDDTATSKARRALSDSLRLNAGNIKRFSTARVSKEQAAALKQKLATTILDGASSQTDALLELDSFFDSLRICVQNNLCDRKTASEFFAPYATWLIENFGSVIDERAQRATGFGRGTRSIAGDAA
ncbi:hypothetical protein [Mesorhizobium sp.]|uniref:hypothetical protein n=1 Tax=Mesorhizobium sp. TaxID=1871066 RepID=UPI000FE88226|nr:hypothetical protein [Mesorhizobium sp.]RWO49223.1 MAG: hypothetical protein EOS13_23075 [Mesorhizobium sp.]